MSLPSLPRVWFLVGGRAHHHGRDEGLCGEQGQHPRGRGGRDLGPKVGDWRAGGMG